MTMSMTWALAGVGVLLGVIQHRWLARRAYRKDGERTRMTWLPAWWATGAAVGALFMAASLSRGSWALAPVLAVSAVAVPLSWIDVDVHRLPNSLLGPLAVAMLLAAAAVGLLHGDWSVLGRVVAGAVTGLGVSAVLLVARAGFGAGDLKLLPCLAAAGAWISWAMLVRVLAYAFVGNGLLLVVLIGLRVVGRGRAAMGPGLLLGALVALLLP